MRLSWIHPFVAIVVFSMSCDESLPPRQDPANLFAVQIQQSYLYDANNNSLLINLFVYNNFDETLSDRMSLTGTIAVTSNRDSSVHKTFQLSAQNLIHGTYDPSKGTLTINPGDFAELQVIWDFTDDSGNSLGSYFFEYHVDPNCREHLISTKELFTISGKTRLYANLGYAQSQLSFQIQQYDMFVAPRYCHPL